MAYSIPNLYIWPQFFLFIGRGLSTRQHEHHAVQFALAMDQPFILKTESHRIESCWHVLIRPDVPHFCQAPNSTILFLNIYPETSLATSLKGNLGKDEIIFSTHPTFRDEVKKIYNQAIDQEALEKIHRSCLALLNRFSSVSLIDKMDDRIINVLRFIRQHSGQIFSLEKLASEACLSEGRLTHLFKEQVGIPIRRYILWQRTCHALRLISGGEDFTGAAIESGFSDSSHLTRTFNMIFGLPPSELFNNSQFIQARLYLSA